MERPNADLAALQSNCKRDPEGYADEFDTQLRHYAACLDIFALQPGRPHRELGELALFTAALAHAYPSRTARVAPDLTAALAAHAPAMHPDLRLTFARALMLLRNRNAVAGDALLPVWLSLLALPDKPLRSAVAAHIIADVKRANAKSRADKFNRGAQAALGGAAAKGERGAARAALGLLAGLWRRNVWRDARTANAIAGAVSHPDEGVAVAALKFFLGEDEAGAGADSDSDDGDGAAAAVTSVAGPDKAALHRAHNLGTTSSKKKKQAKLKRVVAAVKRAARREKASTNEGFAAIQLLYDPQTFAERLFARLRGGGGAAAARAAAAGTAAATAPARPFARHDARIAGVRVLSRVVGTHRLLLLNIYPWLQKSLAPASPDVHVLLAALAQATHDGVPPDALAPVLRQLADSFVHDRARPEVAVAGLKAVAALCARAPLAIDQDLLSDLVAYKKDRHKEVASAARALVTLYRDVAPGMLARRERGRGADADAAPAAFGAAAVATRVPGAELLEAEERREAEEGSGSEEDEEEDGEEEGSGWSDGSEATDGGASSDDDGSHGTPPGSDAPDAPSTPASPRKRPRPAPEPESLASLRKQVAAAAAATAPGDDDPSLLPIEAGRILDDADFARIRELKRAALVSAAMAKHGLKSASKRARAEAAAEDAADEAMAAAAARAVAPETAVDPASLAARARGRADKEARLATVLAGREGRAFGAAAARRKKKTGGRSNAEKARAKALPLAARNAQARKRAARGRSGRPKRGR